MKSPIPQPRPFYDPAVMPPPLGVVVLVMWDGRGPFEAARVAHPRTKREAWLTHHKGEAVLLPVAGDPPDPARPWRGWHTLKGMTPDGWSPRDPAKWGLRLPAVKFWHDARPGEIRFSTTRQSFDAVNAALEMEADRDAARSDGVAPPRHNRRDLWWLDISKIRYRPAGAISKREAEGRLMRALASDGFAVNAGTGLAEGWLKREIGEDACRELASIEERDRRDGTCRFHLRFEPLRSDQDDYLTAMGWFTALGAAERSTGGLSKRQTVLVLASLDLGLAFPEIGNLLRPRAGGRWTRELYTSAIERVWAIANGFADAGVTAQAEALNTLRDGNRKSKRTGT